MKLFDLQANFVRRIFTPDRVMTLGIIMVDFSLGFTFYYPFSGEKFGVYWMSQLALMFAGILCVVEAQRMETTEGPEGTNDYSSEA